MERRPGRHLSTQRRRHGYFRCQHPFFSHHCYGKRFASKLADRARCFTHANNRPFSLGYIVAPTKPAFESIARMGELSRSSPRSQQMRLNIQILISFKARHTPSAWLPSTPPVNPPRHKSPSRHFLSHLPFPKISPPRLSALPLSLDGILPAAPLNTQSSAHPAPPVRLLPLALLPSINSPIHPPSRAPLISLACSRMEAVSSALLLLSFQPASLAVLPPRHALFPSQLRKRM